MKPLLSLLAMLILAQPTSSFAQINVIISGGFSAAYREVLPAFERTTGITVTTASGASQGNGPGTFPPIQQFAITADEIVGADDVAFVRGRYELTAAAPGSAPMTDHGNYMGLLRKQPDGSWLWTTDMISSELPAAQ